ncbi:MAG: hypothetical protein ACKOC5_13735 [Chloroflexota bacterium]
MNPEEQKPGENGNNDAPINDLEDTRPRRVSSAPAQPAETPAEAAPVADALIAAQEAAPDETPASAGQSLEHTQATPLPPAGVGFEETLPPPPEAPVDEPVEFTQATPALEGAASRRPAPGKAAGKKPGTARPGGKKPANGKPGARRAGPPRRMTWILAPLLGLGILLLLALASAGGGYVSGIGMRREAEKTSVASSAMEQFQLGLQDMADQQFDRARQRFEYVIQINPSFPGATEKLAEVLLYLNATATPTLQATPTLTPTPDTRANEELFSQAENAIASSDWDAALDALLALRAKDVNYRVVDVDGMMFLTLRNRGWKRITAADLEAGIYDLTLAENFAPLDSEAKGLVTWTQMYITGASFWGIDWAQAVQYFSQVAPQMPNLMDASGMTASERYRRALFEYGNSLAAGGQACQAVEQYQLALSMGPDAEIEAALNNAAGACQDGGQPEATQKPKKTKTP